MNRLNVKNCGIIKLPKIGDEKRGFLSFGESLKEIPFEIRRIYYIYGVGDLSAVRGEHAHKKLEQVFFCVRGKAIFLLDDGDRTKKVELKEPSKGLYIGPQVWHKITGFTKDTVVLAIASGYYDETDYIRDYAEFIDYIHK